jgi:predicted dehydrogenase
MTANNRLAHLQSHIVKSGNDPATRTNAGAGLLPSSSKSPAAAPLARIAVIGAAWWSQGWHLPQLDRNPDAQIAAIMQRSEQPTAASFLNLTLETKTQLAKRYPTVPIFGSCEELLADPLALAEVDGVIICTAHAAHADMGSKFLAAGKHVMMEKPMTVDVAEARALAEQATASGLTFMVNNTANYRQQAFEARKLVESGELGDIHHVLCVMYSPLMFLFDDPANDGWVKPTGTMVQPDGSGNGFGWGQSSHAVAWPLFVGGLDIEEVSAPPPPSRAAGH